MVVDLPSAITLVVVAQYIRSKTTVTAVFATPTSAREAGIWDYPATADERAQCAVFRDLWEKGYSMGGGIKFGGDYLVYPGTHFSILVTVFVEHSVHPL